MSTRLINHTDVVPGTVHLVDVPGNHGTSNSKDGIELVPRPSDDPEDPLNWSKARKHLSISMVLVHSMGVGFTMALQYSVLADITRDTGIPTAPLVEGSGYMILLMGWGNLFWQPIAITYGRRGVYLLSALGTIPVMVWTAYTSSTGTWYANRIILGFFCAPIECLPEVSIPDIFFAHDRGTWMSLYVFVLFGSNFVAPLVAGWFAEAFGWRWTMYFGALIAAATFVILFFFMEETMYFRKTLEGLEDADDSEPELAVTPPSIAGDNSKKNESPNNSMDGRDAGGPSTGTVFPAKKSYFDSLLPFVRMPGRPSNTEMFKNMLLPIPIIFQFPNVAWAGFIYGINLCWYNVLNATASPLLSAPPYNWSTGLVGCIYIGPLIGAAFGSVWSGVVADRFTLWLARRNNGVREPEQRLWPLTLAAVTSCVGLIVWGVGAEHQIHWAGLAAGLAILTFSCIAGGSVALSYNIDCFKDISGHSTTSIILIRNTMGFAMSYGITPWYTNMGLQNSFIMAGFLSLGCNLSFLLMIWKGKALRRRSAERYWKYAENSVKHE